MTGRLLNLSIRAQSGPDSGRTLAGWVVSGGSSKKLLVRAVGPGLAGLGVEDTVSDPGLALRFGPNPSATAEVDQNDDWHTLPETAAVAGLFTRLGAFPLESNSRDAVLISQDGPGSYTAIATVADNDIGINLLEVYDADETPTNAALVNLSGRGLVDRDHIVLIGGFVVADAPVDILIRAVGPTLADYGVGNPLADPQLTLVRHDDLSAEPRTNDDWHSDGNATMIAAIAAELGAFALPNDSKDATLIAHLEPGTYTAIVSSRETGPGIALLELYSIR